MCVSQEHVLNIVVRVCRREGAARARCAGACALAAHVAHLLATRAPSPRLPSYVTCLLQMLMVSYCGVNKPSPAALGEQNIFSALYIHRASSKQQTGRQRILNLLYLFIFPISIIITYKLQCSEIDLKVSLRISLSGIKEGARGYRGGRR